jgi:hypothetical protein
MSEFVASERVLGFLSLGEAFVNCLTSARTSSREGREPVEV